jgi:lipoyl(octanoyl) transferase
VRKIASIGVHVQRGVATHGFAVNVANDLAPFDWIVACGLPDVRMTSLVLGDGDREPASEGDEAACAARLRCFARRMADSFCRAHARRQRLVTPQRLDRALAAPAWSRDRSGRAATQTGTDTRAPREAPTRSEPVPA